MSIIMRNLLIIILIFCVYLSWGCTEGAQERDSGKVDYHTVQLSSLSSTGYYLNQPVQSIMILYLNLCEIYIYIYVFGSFLAFNYREFHCSGSNTKGSLHVVDKHVVRSPLRRSKVTRLDLENILRQDRARLDYIHSRLSNNFADQPRQTESKDIPVKDVSKRKNELGWGSYIKTIGNGNT